jgi:quinol monooxygenase YgiN
MTHIRNTLLTLLSLGLLGACSSNSIKEQTVQLDTKAEILTVINIMKPKKADKDKVLALLKEGINSTMTALDGYISSSVHSSLDNNYVINYSQWKSMDNLAVAADLVSSGGAPKMVEAFTKGSADYHPVKLVGQYKKTEGKVFIDRKGELLTIINILKPKVGITKQKLVALLDDALKNELLTQDGYISSTVLESMDNDYVINYSQWENQASLEAMVKRLQSGDAPKLGLAFSSSSTDFHPFSITSSHFKK